MAKPRRRLLILSNPTIPYSLFYVNKAKADPGGPAGLADFEKVNRGRLLKTARDHDAG